MPKFTTLLIIVLPLSFFFTSSFGQTLTIEDFSMHGDTYLTNEDCFRLTEEEDYSSGSIWYRRPVSLLSSFSVELTIMVGCQDEIGADGMVFVMTSEANQTGYRGEGIGFAGLFPSIGIEIDTWENEHLLDPAEDHLAIMVNGRVGHYYKEIRPVKIPNIEDCSRHRLSIHWSPVLQNLQVEIDYVEILSFRWDIIGDIFNGNDIVHWGITAATGRYNNIHEVCFDRYAYVPEEDAPSEEEKKRSYYGQD